MGVKERGKDRDAAENGVEATLVKATQKASVTISLFDLYNKFDDELNSLVTKHILNIVHLFATSIPHVIFVE